MRRLQSVIPAAALAILGCGGETRGSRDGGTELTIVVEADKSKIASAERELQDKRAGLDRERELIEQQLETVRSQRSAVQLDEDAKKRLDASERELRAREQQLWQNRDQLERERDQLIKQRDELIARLGTAPAAGAAGGATGTAAAGRDAAFAGREQEMAQREKDLARREASLAEREAAVARREAAAGVPVAAAPVAAGTKAASRGDSDQRHKLFLAQLQAKGLVLSDLPPEAQNAFRSADRARKGGEHATALALYEQAEATIRDLQITAAFVSTKMKRASALRQKAGKLDAKAQADVERRFVTVTELFADAKYGAANAEINQIFAILEK